MWWIWRSFPERDDDFRVAELPPAMRAADLHFNLGVAVTQAVPPIEIVVDDNDTGRLTDNLIGFPRGLAVSAKLRAALTASGADNIQWFPSTVVLRTGRRQGTDYSVANIVGSVAATDFAKSDLVMDDDGTIDFINRLALKPDLPRLSSIFRLAEFLPLVVVHDQVRTAITAAGCSGVQFIEPERLVL